MEGLASSEIVGNGNHLHVKHGDDKGLIVRFYFNKVFEKDYVKINVPGDAKTEWDRPVKPDDYKRFPHQFQQYKAQQSQFGGQTTLEAWEVLGEAQINSLKSFNVFTVENLSQVQDGLVDRMGHGTRELVKRARVWLEEQKQKHNEQVLLSEISKRDVKLEALEKAIQEMQAAGIGQSQPKKRGRKPKGELHDDPK